MAKSYPLGLRRSAVARLNAGEPLARVARQLGVSEASLRRWRSEGSSELEPPAFAAEVASGDQARALQALRDRLATLIEGTESGRDTAALSGRLIEVLARLEVASKTTWLPGQPMTPVHLVQDQVAKAAARRAALNRASSTSDPA